MVLHRTHHKPMAKMVGVTVHREEPLDSSGCNSRPETGSLHDPVAEAASSSVDVLEAGRFFVVR